MNKNSRLLNIVSFLLPLVGMMMYALFKEKEPVTAKGIFIWMLAGFACFLVFEIIIHARAGDLWSIGPYI
jgi:hypothetical protein